jgi:hypothetical protein
MRTDLVLVDGWLFLMRLDHILMTTRFRNTSHTSKDLAVGLLPGNLPSREKAEYISKAV